MGCLSGLSAKWGRTVFQGEEGICKEGKRDCAIGRNGIGRYVSDSVVELLGGEGVGVIKRAEGGESPGFVGGVVRLRVPDMPMDGAADLIEHSGVVEGAGGVVGGVEGGEFVVDKAIQKSVG